MKVQEYIQEDGSNPYQKWFDNLDAIAAAKVTVAKSRLELGNTSNIKWFDGIGEYRIDWGAGYRIYLAQDGNQLIVLFGGGTKKVNNPILNELKNCIKSIKDAKKRLDKQPSKKKLTKRRKRENDNYTPNTRL